MHVVPSLFGLNSGVGFDVEEVGMRYDIQYQSYLTGPKQIALIFDCDELFR